jgi:hypothetical protein
MTPRNGNEVETASRSVKPPTLEALLSGVSPDDVEECRETQRDRKSRPDAVARILHDLKEYEQAERAYEPIEKADRSFSEKRQRLRGPLRGAFE